MGFFVWNIIWNLEYEVLENGVNIIFFVRNYALVNSKKTHCHCFFSNNAFFLKAGAEGLELVELNLKHSLQAKI